MWLTGLLGIALSFEPHVTRMEIDADWLRRALLKLVQQDRRLDRLGDW